MERRKEGRPEVEERTECLRSGIKVKCCVCSWSYTPPKPCHWMNMRVPVFST